MYVGGKLVYGQEPGGVTPPETTTTTTTTPPSTTTTTTTTSTTTTPPESKTTTTTTTTSTTITTTTTTSTSNISSVLYGDVDLSGSVTGNDVIAFIQHFLNKKLTGAALANADVNLDKEVDLLDLATLKQHIMGDKVAGPLGKLK